MTEKNEVFKLIKSVLMSQKGGVLLKDLNRDYRNLAGESIPFKTLGYHSIEDVLDNVPEVQSYLNDEGHRVFTSRGKNCEHLIKLISKQKSTKNNKIKQCNPGFHQGQGKPRNASVSGVVKGKKDFKQYNENYGFYEETSVGSKTRLAKEQSGNYSDEYKFNVRESTSSMSRDYEALNLTEFDFQKNRGRKPLRLIDDLSGHNYWQGDSRHAADQDRVYMYKSSERRETSYCIKNYEPRDHERSYMNARLQFYEDDVRNEYSSVVNASRVERGAVVMNPRVFRAGRSDFAEDFQGTAHGNRVLGSPIGSHKYPKSWKSRSLGSRRYVPEGDEWNHVFFLGRRRFLRPQVWW